MIELIPENEVANPYEDLPDSKERMYRTASGLLIVQGRRTVNNGVLYDSRKIWTGIRAGPPGKGTIIPPLGYGQNLGPREVAVIEARHEAGYDFSHRIDEIRYCGMVADSVHGFVIHVFDIPYNEEFREPPIPRNGILELTDQGWREFSKLLLEKNMTPAVKAMLRVYDISTKLLDRYLFRTRV